MSGYALFRDHAATGARVYRVYYQLPNGDLSYRGKITRRTQDYVDWWADPFVPGGAYPKAGSAHKTRSEAVSALVKP